MSERRVQTRLLIPALFLFLTAVLILAMRRVEAARLVLESPAAAGETAGPGEATATGFVYYDGLPVSGADVTLLRDGVVVYNTTTALGAGSVPSFTVTLSDPPVNAAPGELLTLEVEYAGQNNRTSFVVLSGGQTLAGWLSSTCGPTEVASGLIAANTTWTPACGPYLVRANLLVLDGVTLAVEAGTTVMFDADKALLVNGRLLSQGTPSALATFTKGQELAWGYLSFAGGSTGSSLVDTLVEYAGSTVVDHNAAVRIDGVSASFNGLIVRGSEAGGIQVFNNGAAPMEGLTVLDNQEWGITIDSNDSGLSIQNSLVSGNGEGGIYIDGGANGTISGNTVQNNGESGIKIYDGGDVITVSHNRLVGNKAVYGGGLYFRNTGGAIRDNFIAINDASNYGGGIYYTSTPVEEVEISRNYLIGNVGHYRNVAGGGMFLNGRNVTLTNNIFASNIASDTLSYSAGPGAGLYINNYSLTNHNIAVRYNAFVYNFALQAPAGAVYVEEPQATIEANTFVDNVATSSPAGDWGAVHLDVNVALAHNNLFDNHTYDLYNGALLAEGAINAQSNWWGTTDPTEIGQQVYDWFDDATRGVVDYSGWLAEPWTAAPVSPPSGLELAVEGSSITASWAANPESDLAGYKVYLDTTGSYIDLAVNGYLEGIDVGQLTSFTLDCLPPDTYYLAVTAYDQAADGQDDWTDGNESWFSRHETITTYANPACGPPAAPTEVNATAVAAGQIDLDWNDNADDETAYQVERSPNGATDWSEIASLAANTTAYSDAGLACGATYHYRVRAYRAGDGQFSAYSNVDQAMTTACPPAAPTGLSATAASASQINLSWTDNAADETAYKVERSPDGSSGWNQIASLAANSTSYSNTGLACDTTYFYRARVYRAGDGQYSAYSNVAEATTYACSGPAAPSSLSAAAVSAGQINLTWSDNAADETAYKVERSPDGSSGWSEIASLAANSTAYSNTGLACNTTYFYRARAYRAGDGQYSAYSNVDDATTAACPPPLSPGNLSASSGSSSQINLSWTDNAADETAYRVERSANGSSDWGEIASLAANSTSYSNTGLACGITFYYRVRAYRAGDGQFSAYSNVAMGATQPCGLEPEAYLPLIWRR